MSSGSSSTAAEDEVEQLSTSLESSANISFDNSNRNLTNENTRNSENRRRKTHRPMSIQQHNKKFVKEVHRLVNSKKTMIARLPFSRLVREIMLQRSSEVNRITSTALQALQESCELYITQYLSDAYLLSLHCGRVTLMIRDLHLLHCLHGRQGS